MSQAKRERVTACRSQHVNWFRPEALSQLGYWAVHKLTRADPIQLNVT